MDEEVETNLTLWVLPKALSPKRPSSLSYKVGAIIAAVLLPHKDAVKTTRDDTQERILFTQNMYTNALIKPFPQLC